MLKDERYAKILEILDAENYISSQELAHRLYVSMPTIRRDLAYLEKKKRVVRNHGGARKVNDEYMVLPVGFRETIHRTEKKRLCEAAVKFIKDDSIVFLDGSTTVLQMADFISPKQNITVLTNAVPLSVLLIKKGIKTYSVCGELIENSMAYAGSFAEEFIRKFNIDVCFFSSHGVNCSGMIVDTSLPETQLRQAAIAQSGKTVFLCDQTKFGAVAPYNLVPIEKVDHVITNGDEENPAEVVVKTGKSFIY